MSPRHSIDPCAAERDFLLARMEHGDHTWVGISSNAMVVHVTAARRHLPDPHLWPRDAADLARCQATYDRAPAHLQPAMAPILARWRRHIAEGALYCRGCDNSIGHWSTRNNLCAECYDAQAAA